MRLLVLAALGFVVFKGTQAVFFPPDALGMATVEQIEEVLQKKEPPLTAVQIDQFVQSLRKLRGDPSFERAVDEARKGNTRVRQGIWRQIYDDREKTRRGAQQEQAEAARSLAASAVTNSVAEGLAWYRKAVALDPDNMHGQIGLGDAAKEAGTLAEAGAAFGHYIRLARNVRDDREVSVGLNRLVCVQVAQGDLAGGSTAYRDSLAIAERLAKSDPGNAGWQRDLSVSFDKVGDVLVAQGDLPGALKSYRDSLAIRERLAKSDPGHAGWQRDLSVSFDKVGDVLVAQGDLPGALKSYRDSLAIARAAGEVRSRQCRLAARSVGVVKKVGDVLVAQGDLPGALKSYRDGLAIAERLAKSDPGNAGWQRDLSVSFNKIGDVLVAQGDLPAALKAYRDSLAITERLAKSDPGNAGWQRDLSVSYDKVGDVLVAQGDLPSALKSYRDSLAIARRLAKSDPGNAGWQRDLSVSFDKIGDVLVAQGDLAEALMPSATASPSASGWRSPTPAMPAGSAICRCRSTRSATCRWRRATCPGR